MLVPQIIVNFLQQVCVGAEFVVHSYIDAVEDSGMPGDGFFSHAATESSTGGDGIPKQPTHLLALSATLR
jgi:hypothetical protein